MVSDGLSPMSYHEDEDLPRTFYWCTLRDKSLGVRHCARVQLGIGGRGDYALLQLLIHRRRARYHALNRIGERGGDQWHRHDDAVRRSRWRLSGDRGLGLRHRHYYRRGGYLRGHRRVRRLYRALDFHLQSNGQKTLYLLSH